MAGYKEVVEDFKKAAECPVCLEILTPPVEISCNGHAICRKCKTSLQKCPTCRGRFTEVRNITLDQILESLPGPCMNAVNGCKKVLSKKEKTEHEKICNYKIVKCPYVGCEERGLIYWKLFEHLRRSDHRISIITFGKMASNPAYDFLNLYNRHLILHENTTRRFFSFRCVINWKERNFVICIMFIGRREEAQKYLYEIYFYQNRYIKFSFGGQCLPYMDNIEEIWSNPKAHQFDLDRIFFDGVPSELVFNTIVRSLQ